MYSSPIVKYVGYNPQNIDDQSDSFEVTREDALKAMIAHQSKTNPVNVSTMIKIYMAKRDAHIDGVAMDSIALQFEAMKMKAFPSSNPFEQYGMLNHMQVDQILGTDRIYTAREIERSCIVANQCVNVGDTLLKQDVACAIAEHAIKFSKHRSSSIYLKLLPITTMTEEECQHFHDTFVSTVVEYKHFHAQERRAAHNLKPVNIAPKPVAPVAPKPLKPIAPKPPQAQEPISVSSSPEKPPEPEDFDKVLSDIDGLMNPKPVSYMQFLEDAVIPDVVPSTSAEVQPPSPTGFLPDNMTVEELARSITLDDVTAMIADDLVEKNNATSFIMGELGGGMSLPTLPKKRRYNLEEEGKQAKVRRLEQMLREPLPPPHMVNKFV